ncbi:MAG TPA: NADH-ubiquinone oxidoreductase-F iron-sulfur binding region domain-containing protein [Solirubrobacteraceae bacterium]|nr:NADH-ubiquinone oxidoreductase-F iron-sulfur binding region domain-containing protein [Solirubrobacteraceae bacterium]
MSLPRLLAGIDDLPMDQRRHTSVHGELPRWRATELLAELERSGLRGRGGGGFPLALKLAAVRRGGSSPVVVVNGTESEPMSTKDRLLMWCAPHLIVDGAVALADAIGAAEVIFCLDELEPRIHESLHREIGERAEGRRLTMGIVATPGGYVTGHESAIVHWHDDGIATPLPNPPRVSERGVRRRPTLVANVETVAHVALIARHGADWFRELGTEADPGTALITLSGAVADPGVYEIAHGEPLASLLRTAGGASEPIRAFLVGGYGGGWVDAGELPKLRLSRAQLRPFGTRLGAGVVVALGQSACPVAEIARAAEWLSAQSAGQCGPCIHGLGSIAAGMASIRDGDDPPTLDRVARWCELVTGRGACAHPDGVAEFISSALRVFAPELIDHAELGRCDACDASPTLTLSGTHAVH